MPSPDPARPTTAPRGAAPASRGGRWRLIAGAVLLALIVYGAWQLPTWRAMAATGAAYGARIGCSCHFIEGRDIPSCMTDFEPGMEHVSLSAIDGEQGVRASVPLLASRTAHFHPGTGCMLDD